MLKVITGQNNTAVYVTLHEINAELITVQCNLVETRLEMRLSV